MNGRARKCRGARHAALVVALASMGSILYAGATGEPPVPITRNDPSPFLLTETRVQVTVTGPVARVEVSQVWSNPNRSPVDGLYIFPLPEDAAVTGMNLRIGERVVRGDIRRRAEARAIYEQARREGRVAGLLDQERPNVFAQQVANIMPGTRIEVLLSFDHPVRCEGSGCEYVFPTVVGPRFIPATQAHPGRIAPPVVESGASTGQRLHVEVDLDAGVTLRAIDSPSHAVTIDRNGSDRAHVGLSSRDSRRLDRDFRLRWELGGEGPEIGVLAWREAAHPGDPGHVTLILQPPVSPDEEEAPPRELVFVLDCSGSMSGVPIEAAKGVVRRALGAVRPGDTFQIIRFSERASGLGPEPLPATPGNITRALGYLDSLHGQGGTQMIEGIRAALARPADPERLRIVAFLTDGYIGNESQILAEVRRLIGDARLFSFGIGSSVNRYLLEGLAEEGRGMAAFLGPRERPEEMVERFVQRIGLPVLTDIRITWEDLDVGDLEPERIPDLFAGQALLVYGRYAAPGTGVVIVEGRRAGRIETFRKVAVLGDHEPGHEALGRLWARARIHRLERELHDGDDASIRERITTLGLAHRLVTPWTSLVAVDTEISNLEGSSTQVEVPVEMPGDVSYEGIFGNDAAKSRIALLSAGKPAAARVTPAPEGAAPGRVARLSGSFVQPLAISPAPQAAAEAQELALEAKDESRQEVRTDRDASPLGFRRVTLHRDDGARVIVEEDGEVWLVRGGGRRLLAKVDLSRLVELDIRLGQAGAGTWGDAALSGARLVVHGPAGRSSIAAADPAAARIVELLEGWLAPLE